uniref:NADH-ubiquinone oxidoreductase chain 2 n=1 Tax=Leptobrachella oshanensis TaxID=2769484 RepID=M1RFP4_LEPOH|nr:NADH dehydrogenase subunit 2 [Leptobrachella oshanensis]AGG15981.1 NADH dehydrogenase subunit 2 [Leptobrachella oshanensis]
MQPLAWSVFMSTIGLGTVITMSSHHWLLAWMGLEINTMALIPLLASSHHPRAIEAASKYFLTQAAAAALILFSSINNAWVTGEWDIMSTSHPLSITLITIALSIKLGLAPFHFWLPEVLQGTTLSTGLILTTWQKLAPICLLLMLSQKIFSPLILALATLSIIIGGWGGINQTHIRKIMAYSSIAHLGWMVTMSTISPLLTLLNLFIYIISTTLMFVTFNTLSSTNILTASLSWTKSPITTLSISIGLLSLGGLPPLSGFFPKLLILQELTKQNLLILAFIISVSTLLSLFFYVRLLYSLTLTIHPNLPSSTIWWRPKKSLNSTIVSTMLILTSLLLPIVPTMINI